MEQIHRVRCGTVNCYIIQNGSVAVLVDTGMKKHRERILKACSPFDIRLIVLTHGHVDHVQNAAYLSEKLHAPIAINREDVPLLADNTLQPLYAQTPMGRLMHFVSMRNFRRERIPPFSPSMLLKDGDSLNAYGICAKVVALPGHTNGSIGLDIAGHSLIVGDALMGLPRPGLPLLYHNGAAMRASAARIGGLGARILYFGHGRPAPRHAG
ncbi:MAG: MBL fold metallo-hydrolase [Clostridia bacterium]|nr:MBL fold metallo-hydrolase [Clostridia bacterium]